MYRFLCVIVLLAVGACSKEQSLKAKVSKRSEEKLRTLSAAVLNAAKPKQVDAASILRSTNPRVSEGNVELLTEYGYHWCPEWTGDGWCPEGYLCGDGNNGCAWNACCNDDASIISCPSPIPFSNQVTTPCSANSVPDGGGYYCCNIDLVCGDGTQCTDFCPKGECCEFDGQDVPSSCFPETEDEPPTCPEGVTDECCTNHWSFSPFDHPAVEMAFADFQVCNAPCFAFDNLDSDVDEMTVTTHCNYCLGSFEYVCHREQGAICVMTFQWEMHLDVVATDPQTGMDVDYSGTYTVTQLDYDCIAQECNTNENEDAIEQPLLDDVVAKLIDANVDIDQYENLRADFQCSEIPHIGSYKDVGFNPVEECDGLCPCVCAEGEDACPICPQFPGRNPGRNPVNDES